MTKTVYNGRAMPRRIRYESGDGCESETKWIALLCAEILRRKDVS